MPETQEAIQDDEEEDDGSHLCGPCNIVVKDWEAHKRLREHKNKAISAMLDEIDKDENLRELIADMIWDEVMNRD